MGNPYGLAIDVQNLLNQNQSYYSTIYIWDNETLSYKTHNGISGDIYQGLVAPFEGFLDSNSKSRFKRFLFLIMKVWLLIVMVIVVETRLRLRILRVME